MAATATTHDIDLDALLLSLPACKRCRDCRRGCDTLLPQCRQCTKSGVECVFWDHGRNALISRRYIAQLVDHVRALSARNVGQASPAALCSPSSVPLNSPNTLSGTPQDSIPSSTSTAAKAESDVPEPPSFDHYFAVAGDSYRYLGSESCLVKSPRMKHSQLRAPQIEDDDDWELVLKSTSKNYDLVVLYMDAIQPLYPVMDPSLRFLAPELPSDLKPPEIFCLNMIYSIACHLQPAAMHRKDPKLHWNLSGKLDFHHLASDKYRKMARKFFDSAMEHLQAATVETSIGTLRAVLLLALHSLFDPKSGNIGQQIALATRLLLSLESRLELQELPNEDAEVLRNMHSTIFSLENEIAATLDRPATFPEPDWEIYFDKDKPADYLCSLYRLQHRFRKGDQSVKKLLPLLDERGVHTPGIRMALHQTHLLLNPCWGSAWYVLEAVVSQGSIHVFMTPHWVYRAGCVLIENMPEIWEGNLIQLYSNALVVLELSSGKWPSAGLLTDSLSELMQHMKRKHRPDWAETGLQLHDVRI